MNKLRNILLLNKVYIILVIITIIYALIVTKLIFISSKYKGNENEFILVLNEYKINGNKVSFTLTGKEKLMGSYIIKTKEEKEYLINNLKLGSKLKIYGSLTLPKSNTVPYLFNYKEYLNKQKIFYIIEIDKLELTNNNINIFYKIKNYMYQKANKFKTSNYIYAFLLGKTNRIENDVIESYRTNGISHLFALSGLHVSIFSLVIMKILKKLKISEFKRYIIIFIFLLFFSFLTGFSPSILRASLLFFLLGINKVFYLNIETKNILYLVLIILLIINPFLLYNLSFVLSFTTTFFLIITTNKNNNGYIKKLLITSIISFISNIILSIYYFGYINPSGIILNLIFVPLVTYIVFPLTIITFLIPFLDPILIFFINIMETLSLKLTIISLKIYFPNITLIIVFIYYILLILLIKTKKNKYFIPIIILLICIYIYPYLDSSYYVYYIDVSQGDACLLITPHKKEIILIDTGGKITYEVDEWKKRENTYSISEDTLISLMRKIGVHKLDYLVLTHGDYDHMGESKNLVNNFKVKNVILNCGEYNNLESELINALKDIPFYSCVKSLSLKNDKLYFLNSELFNNENDNSSVIYTKINNYKFLFMGDAGIKREEKILDSYNLSDIDFLKIGHHGSKTSTSIDLINKVNPEYSIISVGENNRYNHPSDSVLEILNNSTIYRTDIDGTIRVKINKDKLSIKTYRKE